VAQHRARPASRIHPGNRIREAGHARPASERGAPPSDRAAGRPAGAEAVRRPGWFRQGGPGRGRGRLGWLRHPVRWFRGPMRRGEKIGLLVAGAAMALVLALEYGSWFGDEPLRRELEAKMNQQMHGYSVQLGHAHGGPLRLSLTLRDVVVRQLAHPVPPVATIPRLHLSVQWHSLLARHLVGDALFERPLLHLNIDQLHEEKMKQLKLGQRGWQAALQSIYPLKFDTMEVRDGSLVYVDGDLARPFEITHWDLTATNIRNLQFPDRTYPSPFHTEARVLGSGWGAVDGDANFLADPIPAWHAKFKLVKVPLGDFQQFGLASPYQFHSGLLSTHGDLEYGPRWKQVDFEELRLEGVRLDYVHAASTAAIEHLRRQQMVEAAKEAETWDVNVRLDRLLLTDGQVGFVNRATQPPYRLFVDRANLEVLNMSNRIASLRATGAVFRLRGRFMGGGTAKLDATFRPGAPEADLGAELAVENARLPAFNDLLLAYKRPDVAGGTVSVYSQIEVKHSRIHGYVKAMFDDIKLDDPRKDRNKSFGARLKEKLIGGLAEMLENKKSDALATRAEITGTLSSPQVNAGQVYSSIIRNAFWKAIKPGFDSAGRGSGGRR
jgi:Domain of Unknown Function (DUF748)